MALTTGLQIPYGVQPVNPVPVDSWSGPYEGSTEQDAKTLANSSIPSVARFKSMEVRLIVNNVAKKYWYRDGVNDSDLVEFASSGGGAGSIAGIISKTYNELKTLKDANQLVPGQYYKITDFQLSWWDYTANNAQELRANTVEPLIILAVAENKFATVAYSTLYPADIIYYDFDVTWGFGKIGFGNYPTPNTRGWITKRIGQQYVNGIAYGLVEAHYDWRNATWSCRRCDLSSVTSWSKNNSYSLRQVVKHYDKLFISISDNNSGRITINDWRSNNQPFTVDNPPDISRAIFDSNRTYNIGDEVAYIAYPAIDPTSAATLNGSLKYYRKTASGAVGVLPTVAATWTEASFLNDFDYSDRIAGYSWWFWKNENFFRNSTWVSVSPYAEGKTYFPTSEEGNSDAFYFVVPEKINRRLPNDEIPFDDGLGVSNGSGTSKYSPSYGKPRYGWNIDIYYQDKLYRIPWDLSTKAQKPTFAQDPQTTNSTFRADGGGIILGEASYANVFYYGCENINLGRSSSFNILYGGNNGSQIVFLKSEDGFIANRIGQGVQYNNFGTFCRSNSFGSQSNKNKLGNGFSYNIVTIDFSNNVFGDTCINNLFGLGCRNNNAKSQFIQNFCAGQFSNNSFGDSIGGNLFNFGTTLNDFDGYCFNNIGTYLSNKIGKEFNNNFASASVYGNVFASANNNNFGTYFENNQCSDYLHCCVFGIGTTKNKFSAVQYLTSIGNLYYNEIDTATRLILGYNFVSNTIKSDTINNINSDFSFGSATLVYNNYPKQIFKNSAGQLRLSYYNQNDQLVITDPTT